MAPLMTDKDLIEEAYADLMKQLFITFFQSFTYAQGDRIAEQDSERIFANGVAHAQFIRDRAKSLLP